MANRKKETVNIQPINPRTVRIRIEGTSDLILNQMNAPTRRYLAGERTGQAKELKPRNVWEEIITSIHWRDGDPAEFTEESLIDALMNNAPCITAFGLKASFKQAVTRNGIAKWSTEFDATMNVLSNGNGLIPIQFSQHFIDEKLMSPKRGAPVLVRLNRFSGWSADIEISFLENVYSMEQILNVINLAGFGLGIGSGRSSGYGRYQIVSVEG